MQGKEEEGREGKGSAICNKYSWKEEAAPEDNTQRIQKKMGIETSYSKIESKAMARSTSNTVRMMYLTSVLVYNAWQLVNIIVAIMIEIELVRPMISKPELVRNITQFTEGG